MNILVVEDKFNDMEYISSLLKEIAPDAKLFKAGDTKSALKHICQEKIDIAFIDVELPDESGFAFASKLREMKEYRLLNIVFVTGTNENPLKAHREYHCYDYIKKPYTKNIFKKIVTPLIEGINSCEAECDEITDTKSRIVFLKAGQEMYIVKTDDIFFAEITGREVTVHCTDKVIEGIRMKFEDFVRYINLDSFVRCHKSFAVNTEKIQEIISINYRLWEVGFGEAYQGDKKCLMSKVYRENVEKCLLQRI